MSRRTALAAAGASAAVLVAIGTFLSVGPPRLLALNTGLRVEYGWPRPAGAALVCAAGLLLAIFGRRWLRAGGVTLALAGLLAGLHLSLYRVEADARGIASRTLSGSTRLTWTEVDRVDAGPGLLLVSGAGRTLRVDTTDFRPDQRAMLDRTIARRLREPVADVR